MHQNHYKTNFNILMLAPSFYPAYGAECLVNAKLALAFLNQGWGLSVISHTDREHDFFADSDDRFWGQLDEVLHSIKVKESKSLYSHFIKLKTFLKTGHLINGMLWVRLCIQTAEELLRKKRYDVILSRAIPEFCHLSAMHLSKKHGIPWIANWNDPVPNCKFIQPSGLGPEAPIKCRNERFLKAVFKSAHWHTFPSSRLQRYICGYIKEDIHGKSSVIPHIALDHFMHHPEQTSKFILCHTGGLSLNARNPYFLLKPLSETIKAKRVGTDIEVRFYGNCSHEILEMANHLGISSHVQAESWISYERSLNSLREGSVSVIIEEEMPEGIYLPSKIADYVQIGNPILAIGPKAGTIRDHISKYGGGYYAYCKDENSISSGIETLYHSWKERTLLNRFSLKALAVQFCEKNIIDQYISIFNELHQRNRIASEQLQRQC